MLFLQTIKKTGRKTTLHSFISGRRVFVSFGCSPRASPADAAGLSGDVGDALQSEALAGIRCLPNSAIN